MVWNVDKAAMTVKFAVNSSPLGTSIALSSDGKRLVIGRCITSTSGCQQSEVLLWAMRTGQLTRLAPIINGSILDVAFTHDGSMVAASGTDRITLWTIATST